MFSKFLNILIGTILLLVSNTCKTTTNTSYSDLNIDTDFGTMCVKLYTDTPLHHENFLSLVKMHYFDGLLFHRVIPSFMIQGGDPDSKNAPSGMLLGNVGPGYTIEAEIVPNHFHKRGVLSAARESDSSNPFRRSGASQFYIVTGRTYTDEELDKIENYIQQQTYQNLYLRWQEELKNQVKQSGQTPDVALLSAISTDLARNRMLHLPFFHFSPEQRSIYKTIGGAPHLDNLYTVFGEVVQGIESADKMASLERDKNDRPLHDVKMKISLVKQHKKHESTN